MKNKNLLDNIDTYKLSDGFPANMVLTFDGDYVKYEDVEKLIKQLKEKHELELDKVYGEGYDKGLDAAYISNQSSGLVGDPQ
jgi:hypothetical protein